MSQDSDGLARIQSESRIPASTWRQWCERLGLDRALAVELWEDVCHPMMIASGQAPDIPLILQLRATRPHLYIDDFRDELPAVLLSITFLCSLQDEGQSSLRSAFLRLYRHLDDLAGPAPVSRPFVAHAGALGLLGGILPQDQGITKLVRVLCSGRGALDDLVRIGRRGLGDPPQGDVVAAALEAALALLAPAAGSGPTGDGTAEAVTDASLAAADRRDEAAEPGADDDDEDDAVDEDDTGDPDGDAPEDEAQSRPDVYARFLDALRPALAAVYADEAVEPQTRAARLRAIQGYNPMKARIPSMEEAYRMSAQSPAGGEGRNRALRPQGRAPRAMAAPSGGGPSRVIPGGVSRGSAAEAAGRAATVGGGQVQRDAAAPEGAAESPSATAPPAPASDRDGKLPAPPVSRRDLDAVVSQVADALKRVRELDARVWQLFAEPEAVPGDPRALAEAMREEDGDPQRAADALRLAAQPQRVRAVLALPEDRRLKERRFDLEVEAWLNAVANNRRALDPDSRLLIPLPKVLDRAAAALVRVEALRAAVAIATETETEDGAAVTGDVVTARYEHLLSELTCLANSAVVADARTRAEADVDAVLAAIAAEDWIEAVRSAALAWVQQALEAGSLASTEALAAHLQEAPLRLAGPPPPPTRPPAVAPAVPEAAPFPDELAADTPLGEVVDTVRAHVLRAAWDALRQAHDPRETVTALDTQLRLRLRGQARLTPRRERHQRNPRVVLPVTSLERLSGNPELAHLFVRLTPDGRLLFLEDYEDGSYIDVFELRQSKKRQMHARARERARAGDGSELQTGSSYMHTRGRTNNPFARTEAEVMAASVVDEDGDPVLFEPF